MSCGPTRPTRLPIPNTDPGPDGVLGTGDDGGAVTYYDYTAAYAGSAFVQNKDLNTDGYDEQLPQHRSRGAEAAVEQLAARHLVPGHPHGHVAQRHPAGSERRRLLPEVEVLGMGLQAVGQLRAAVADPGGRDVHEPERRRCGPGRRGSPRASSGSRRSSCSWKTRRRAACRRRTSSTCRFEKRQKIGPGTAAFQLDLFNVTNTNVELGVTTRSGANFNKITSIVPPFVAKLGVAYTF